MALPVCRDWGNTAYFIFIHPFFQFAAADEIMVDVIEPDGLSVRFQLM